MIANVGSQPIKIEDSAVARSSRIGFRTMTSATTSQTLPLGIKVWGSKGWLQLHQMRDMPLHWYLNGGEVEGFEGSKQPRGYTPFVQACVDACQQNRSTHHLGGKSACHKNHLLDLRSRHNRPRRLHLAAALMWGIGFS